MNKFDELSHSELMLVEGGAANPWQVAAAVVGAGVAVYNAGYNFGKDLANRQRRKK